MPRWISASRLESRLVACVVVGTWIAGSGIDQPARAEWSAIAEQRVSYTTDAFQFSSARRLALSEDPSLPTAVGLGNPEDVIWEPSVEVIRSGTVGLGRNELSVKAHGFIYTDKPIFNHGEYRIQDRQWLNRDTSVLLRYRYLPNLFLGPNFERRSGNQTESAPSACPTAMARSPSSSSIAVTPAWPAEVTMGSDRLPSLIRQ